MSKKSFTLRTQVGDTPFNEVNRPDALIRFCYPIDFTGICYLVSYKNKITRGEFFPHDTPLGVLVKDIQNTFDDTVAAIKLGEEEGLE